MASLGASPLASFASPSKDTFSGDNSTTAFTMGQSVGDPNQIEVFVDNVRQEPTEAYTCLLYTSPSPRDMWTSRMPSSA